MTKKNKTTTSKTIKSASVRKSDGKITGTKIATRSSKKEKWLQFHVECSVNTDTAPKWFKEETNSLKRKYGFSEEEAVDILVKSINTFWTRYLHGIAFENHWYTGKNG